MHYIAIGLYDSDRLDIEEMERHTVNIHQTVGRITIAYTQLQKKTNRFTREAEKTGLRINVQNTQLRKVNNSVEYNIFHNNTNNQNLQ